jgi:hypothetical protein
MGMRGDTGRRTLFATALQVAGMLTLVTIALLQDIYIAQLVRS